MCNLYAYTLTRSFPLDAFAQHLHALRLASDFVARCNALQSHTTYACVAADLLEQSLCTMYESMRLASASSTDTQRDQRRTLVTLPESVCRSVGLLQV